VSLFSCANDETDVVDHSIETPHKEVKKPAELKYDIISQYTHDTSAYTQGLEFYNGKLYEGTGDYENSSLRITDVKTGAVLQKHLMGSAEVFGEGITIFNNQIFQLTWESNIVYVYDVSNINKPIRTINWPYDGWGITHNDTMLIISDGSASIYYVSPNSFKVQNVITVKDNYGRVENINELEYVDGFIFANVYQTNRIIKIDPESGKIVADMFLNNLLKNEERTLRTDYFNGIAYNKESKTFFVTGKRWPKMFELRLH
jgi:glutamine cyclotransferase